MSTHLDDVIRQHVKWYRDAASLQQGDHALQAHGNAGLQSCHFVDDRGRPLFTIVTHHGGVPASEVFDLVASAPLIRDQHRELRTQLTMRGAGQLPGQELE